MTSSEAGAKPAPQKTEHFDVLIVGAGISGVGAAYHLTQQCPERASVVLEGLESFGGTWLMHRYPGIRSDSDLYTFGYRFKPWTGPPIATAEEILTYMGEVIDENDLGPHIRYGHKIQLGKLVERRQPLDDRGRADGYRRARTLHRQLPLDVPGLLPPFEGLHARVGRDGGLRGRDRSPADLARGPRLQGQERPRDRLGRHCGDARSGDRRRLRPRHGAAAFSDLLHSGPQRERARRPAARAGVDETWIHEITRRKILHDPGRHHAASRSSSRRSQEGADRSGSRAYLGPDYDIEKHFTPKYRPWQQRIAFVPDGDVFQGIASGKASIVTDEIDRFTKKGILLKSGEELEADIIVTATGFNLSVLGDIDFAIDGKPLDFSEDGHLPRHDVHRACPTCSGSSGTSGPAGPCGSTCSATSSTRSPRSTWTLRSSVTSEARVANRRRGAAASCRASKEGRGHRLSDRCGLPCPPAMSISDGRRVLVQPVWWLLV